MFPGEVTESSSVKYIAILLVDGGVVRIFRRIIYTSRDEEKRGELSNIKSAGKVASGSSYFEVGKYRCTSIWTNLLPRYIM